MFSLGESVRRFLNFILTTATLRPDLLYSAFCTTIGSLPIMITLPTRSSCASFMLVPAEKWLSGAKLTLNYNRLPQNFTRFEARSPFFNRLAHQLTACVSSRSLCRQNPV